MIKDLLDLHAANILVIDDEDINLAVIEELLEDEGFPNATLYNDPLEAIKHYKNNPPDLVLLDLNMPELTGFEVLQKFEEINHQPQPPVIVITALNNKETCLQALELGARDFLNKPFDSREIIKRIHNLLEMHLAHKENLFYSANLETLVKQRTQDLLNTQNEMIERLGLAAEYRDTETAAHTIRVGHYCRIIAIALGLTDREAEQLKLAAPMHDIGKIGIPDSVLLKQGKLNAAEWALMKKHSEYGYDLLKNSTSTILKNAGIIALAHHEKWNGSGYPLGLKETEIHLYGRITAITDVFDALTMSRPYKKAWAIKDAVHLINEESGIHFDPDIVAIFNQVLDQLLVVRKEFSD